LSALLARHDFRARRRLGQNFLVDRNILEKILDAVDLSRDDSILEIGAGAGTLTAALGRWARRVITVETDRRLSPILAETVGGLPQVTVVMSDFLEVDLDSLLTGDETWKVVGNLPYYVTTPIIERLIEHRQRFSRWVLMMQREVAERLTASPGGKAYGSLTVFVQAYCQLSVVGKVSPTCFLPQPEVHSSLLRFDVRPEPAVAAAARPFFFQVVRAAFGQRRKRIANALAGSTLGLEKTAIEALLARLELPADARAEQLSIEQFGRLTEAIEETRP
jgi:16S rRNA (adenine1518-N6/adenine1519-N6)-dimethyltransferase